MTERIAAVTGAFGYSGQYIAQRLLARGDGVRNLTNSPLRTSPLRDRVETHPLTFDDPGALATALSGVDTLYNTYWVRFNRAGFRQSDAVKNTLKLFEAARRAGVRRIVHVSITNPSGESPLAYFSGKARLERALRDSGVSYAILRPTVLFGREDVLINNIAWMLRRFPVFGLFGDGSYRLQPIFVDDLAELAVRAGGTDENQVIDAIGPEAFTYRELVELIGACIGTPRPLIALPPVVAYVAGWVAGVFVRDVIITREEIAGLMAGLLCTNSPPAGTTRLSGWLRANADSLGVRYTSELARRWDRLHAYPRSEQA